jgi:hypothetical protein
MKSFNNQNKYLTKQWHRTYNEREILMVQILLINNDVQSTF